jgi:hypothetical protein
MSIPWYVGDIRVADLEATAGEEISILENGEMTPVRMIQPPYTGDEGVRGVQPCWSVDVTMIGASRESGFMFSFPAEPSVETVVQRSVGAWPDDVRLGSRGVVLQQHGAHSFLSLRPVPTKEVFRALFRQAGVLAEPSQPGRYAEQIIKKMGSLHGGCRILKLRGVRQLLDTLGDDSTLTKGNMHQTVMSVIPGPNGRNWRPDLYDDLILRNGQKGPLKFGTIFEVLLEKRVLRPGFIFKCPTCFKRDWYHVSEFTEEYTCRFCFTTQRVNFADKHEWQYKADGLFRIRHSAAGSVAVILSLWRFDNMALLRDGRYCTSQDLLVEDTGRRYELDFAYLFVDALDTSYDLVIGQATGFLDFTDIDMHNMAELADRFARKPYLAFSTLRDRYSDADRARLRDLSDRGYQVIPLTREELDPYDLYRRFEDAPHRYAVRLSDLADNALHLNVLR